MNLQWVDWLVLGVLGFGFVFIALASVRNWRGLGKPGQSENAVISGSIALLVQFAMAVALALTIALYWKFLAG